MTIDETLELLERIALIDDRVVKTDETEQTEQLTLWARVLRDVPLDFAGQALGDHYAESAWPVMPKDIAARWRTVYRDRLARHTHTFEPTAHPHVDPDDITGYQLALRAERQAVTVGVSSPTPVRALLSGGRSDGGPVPANQAFHEARAAMRRAAAERRAAAGGEAPA